MDNGFSVDRLLDMLEREAQSLSAGRDAGASWRSGLVGFCSSIGLTCRALTRLFF